MGRKRLLNEDITRNWAKHAGLSQNLVENFLQNTIQEMPEEEGLGGPLDGMEDPAGEIEEMPPEDDMGGLELDLDDATAQALIQLGQQLEGLMGGAEDSLGDDLSMDSPEDDLGGFPSDEEELQEGGKGHPKSASGKGPATKGWKAAPKPKLQEEEVQEEAYGRDDDDELCEGESEKKLNLPDLKYESLEDEIAEALARKISNSMLKEQKKKQLLKKIDIKKISQRISQRIAEELTR